eukprot:TRINITY_DN4003_c0_g1_i1.p1 TRINITY_DN4003_c0_g1~~TRINITY_DN4003_c0_g1_i1.p1  ORF type:complete len:124 (-),score=21.31 TRINITY_DN4003_c0_g1_i1:37-408(-)
MRIGEHMIKLQLWQPATEKFRATGESVYRGSHAIIVIFDLTNQHSFDNVKNWLREVERYERENVVIVDNKCDLEPAVDLDSVRDFCDQRDLIFFQASAKDGTSVDDAFLKVAEQAIIKIQEDS